MNKPVQFNSKLPNVGTSIFTVITAEAEKYGAINLAQGFPNFDCDPRLKQLVNQYLQEGKNQYAPMAGLLQLREAISEKMRISQSVAIDAGDEITITAGATQALFTAIATFVGAGDEVIIFEPAYDSYAPAVRTVGGHVVYLTTLAPNFEIDFDHLTKLISQRTKMIIINTPGNPTTKLWNKQNFDKLGQIIEGTDIIVLSDEVYEHLVYDQKRHISALSIESLRNRAIAVYSFGKTFHNTGWKIGYAIASKELTKEFRKVHQFNVFCVNSFVQHGLAAYLDEGNIWKSLPDFYDEKRKQLSNLMAKSKYVEIESEGSFFCLCNYEAISAKDDQTFVKMLIQEYGIAAIPLSAFYHRPPPNEKYIRLCFAKDEATLIEGAQRLLKVQDI